ncbi:MAG: hypothetical protein Q8P28_04270 [Deltaproteobacteria bacterium]|nr:hypothetical protein [Deltaproteobacteria bacterium]
MGNFFKDSDDRVGIKKYGEIEGEKNRGNFSKSMAYQNWLNDPGQQDLASKGRYSMGLIYRLLQLQRH